MFGRGKKDIAKLRQTVIINKKGVRQTVYVKMYEETVWDILKRFFRIGKDQAKGFPDKEFDRNNIGEKYPDVDKKSWKDHFLEYFRNKARWDAFFMKSRDAQKEKKSTTGAGKSVGKMSAKDRKTQVKFNVSVMRILYAIYGDKQPLKEEAKIEEEAHDIEPTEKPFSDAGEVQPGADHGHALAVGGEERFEQSDAGPVGVPGIGVGERPGIHVPDLTLAEMKKVRAEVKRILAEKTDDQITEEDKKLLRLYEGGGTVTDEESSLQEFLYAYYTPHVVVDKMWELMDKYIRPGSDVLEPSAGTGRFAEHNKHGHKMHLNEFDPVSARIAKILYPGADVTAGPFQRFFMEGNKPKKKYEGKMFDAVIGNPPYGKYEGFEKGLGEGREHRLYSEYFMDRSLDTLKPGGTMVMLVPSSFMRRGMDGIKEKIAGKGRLMEAFRLPNNIFTNADIGTDVLVIRKEPGDPADFTPEYFTKHPENILGDEVQKLDRFKKLTSYIQGDVSYVDRFRTDAEPPTPRGPMAEETKEKIAESLRGNKNAEKPFSNAKKRERIKKETEVRQEVDTTPLPTDTYTLDEFIKQYGGTYDKYTLELWSSVQATGEIGDLGKVKKSGDGTLTQVSVDPLTGKYYIDELYASGNIYQKLDNLEAQKGVIVEEYGKAQYEKQLSLLKSAVPTKKKIGDVVLNPISTFCREYEIDVPAEEGQEPAKKSLIKSFKEWFRDNVSSPELRGLKYQDVFDYVDGVPVRAESVRGRGYKTEEKIAAEKERNQAIAMATRSKRRDVSVELFNRYIKDLDNTDRQKLENSYNRYFNNTKDMDYTKVPIFVEGLSKTFTGGKKLEIRPIQQEGIARLCSKGTGLLAYDVGVGKTLTGIVATIQQMQRGWAKRPLFVVPKAVYKKWIKEIKTLFPDLKLNELGNLGAGYEVDPTKIKDGTVSICTYQGMKGMTFHDETVAELTGELKDVMAKVGGGEAGDKKKSKRAQAAMEERIQTQAGRGAKVTTGTMNFFEDFGFDHVTADEVHNFKNLFSGVKADTEKEEGEKRTKEFSEIKGGAPSDAAAKFYMVSQYIQKHNENRGVFMLSATPFTNSPVEIYNILSYVARGRLKDMGLTNLEEFMSMFVRLKTEWTTATSASGFKKKDVVKEFNNLTALRNLINEYIDFRSGEEAGIVRPDKKVHLPEIPQNNLQKIITGVEQVRAMTSDRDHPENALLAINNMLNVCLFPNELYEAVRADRGGFYEDNLGTEGKAELLEMLKTAHPVKDSPKMKFVCDSVSGLYGKRPDLGQIIFCPRGTDNFPKMVDYLVEQGIPRESIAVMTGGDSGDKADERKAAIVDDFNNPEGKIKVIIGTDTIKEGVDLNGNTAVAYDCMLQWNPSDTQQKQGRLWRQGNRQGKVHIVYPLVQDSVDAGLYQKHDEKLSRFAKVWGKTEKDVMDISDINPADLKFSLIKDPEKRADLMIQLKIENIMLKEEDTKIQLSQRTKMKQEYMEAEQIIEGLKKKLPREENDLAESGKKLKEEQEKIKKFMEERGIKKESDLSYSDKYDLDYAKREYDRNKRYLDDTRRDLKLYERKQEKIEEQFAQYGIVGNDPGKQISALNRRMEKIKKFMGMVKEQRPKFVEAARQQIESEIKVLPPVDELTDAYLSTIMSDIYYKDKANEIVKAIIGSSMTATLRKSGDRLIVVRKKKAPMRMTISIGRDGMLKARAAQIGEVRTWSGEKYRKVGEGKWEPVVAGGGKAGGEETKKKKVSAGEDKGQAKTGGKSEGKPDVQAAGQDEKGNQVAKINGSTYVQGDPGSWKRSDGTGPEEIREAGGDYYSKNASGQWEKMTEDTGKKGSMSKKVMAVKDAVKNAVRHIADAIANAYLGKPGEGTGEQITRTGQDVSRIGQSMMDGGKTEVKKPEIKTAEARDGQ